MKERVFVYRARLRSTSGTVLVRFPDLPEALTEGADRDDALAQASDCLEEAIGGRIRRGEPIPVPSPPRPGDRQIALPAPMAAKASLYIAACEAKISNAELAKRLGCDEKEIRRLLDPRHPSKLPRIERALAALGRRLVVQLQAA